MQVKWFIPVIVGGSLFSACGDSTTATSTTAVNLSSTAFATIAPTLSTIATTSTGPTEGQVSPTAQSYTIVAGDVPVNVAKAFGVTLDALNLANANTPGYAAFFVGLVINIPEGALVPAPTTTAVPGAPTTLAGTVGAATTTVAPNANGCTPGTHEIVAGDLPGTVAKQYDVTVAQLDAANVNTKGYTNFVVGVKIIIPCP
jgi:LysM repeat protein